MVPLKRYLDEPLDPKVILITKQEYTEGLKNKLYTGSWVHGIGLWELAASCGACRQAGSGMTGVKLLR